MNAGYHHLNDEAMRPDKRIFVTVLLLTAALAAGAQEGSKPFGEER
jgi:hypothetical protein